jgi:hypothetical protein
MITARVVLGTRRIDNYLLIRGSLFSSFLFFYDWYPYTAKECVKEIVFKRRRNMRESHHHRWNGRKSNRWDSFPPTLITSRPPFFSNYYFIIFFVSSLERNGICNVTNFCISPPGRSRVSDVAVTTGRRWWWKSNVRATRVFPTNPPNAFFFCSFYFYVLLSSFIVGAGAVVVVHWRQPMNPTTGTRVIHESNDVLHELIHPTSHLSVSFFFSSFLLPVSQYPLQLKLLQETRGPTK